MAIAEGVAVPRRVEIQLSACRGIHTQENADGLSKKQPFNRNSPPGAFAGVAAILAAGAPPAQAAVITINGPGPGGIPPQSNDGITEHLIPGQTFPGVSTPMHRASQRDEGGTEIVRTWLA